MSIFTDKAPSIMRALMKDFDLDDLSAAAIVGNLGHESGGFRFLQEKKPLVPGSKGGYGWAQWTGPRRRLYEAYCKRNNLDPASDKANYGFLFVELKGSEAKAIPAVKVAKEVRDAKGNITKSALASKVEAFERAFERAGIKHYPSRNNYTAQALKAYHAAEPPKTTEAKTKDVAKAGGGAVVAGAVATGVNAGWGLLEWAVAAGCLIILAAVAYGAFYWYRHRRVVPVEKTPVATPLPDLPPAIRATAPKARKTAKKKKPVARKRAA